MPPLRVSFVAIVPTLLLLTVAGCSMQADTTTTPTSVSFNSIDDQTGSDYYAVAPTATAVTDDLGTTLTLGFIISHANQTIFDPKAVVTFEDGSAVTCQETDLRRLPSLVATTTTWDLPCESDFPEKASGATITVTDDYAG